jgi:hypothetical protein
LETARKIASPQSLISTDGTVGSFARLMDIPSST